MQIAEHISTLLYEHDCVIVPGLGGFVANYKPAYVQTIKHTFHPPSKGISFNKNLQNNDGLLANHTAQKEGISYNEACGQINEFVHAINEELNKYKSVQLGQIGKLFIDGERRMRFEPDTSINYLLNAYGLCAFHKQPISRERIEDRLTKEFVDRTAPLVKESKKSKKWMVAAAITIPLAFFAIWLPSKYDLGADINYAELNPFTPDLPAKYSKQQSNIVFNNSDETPLKEQLLTADQNAETVTVILDNTELVVRLKDKTAEPVSTYVATTPQELTYHIVGGCFSSKANAKKMVRKLKREGFDASIIGKRKGLWTVSYNSFATRREAVNALSEAKAHNEKAWVLNY